jgi:glyceraldehyde 3-phosphate dehydrogenase
VETVGDEIAIDGQVIPALAETDPARLPRRELGVDVMIESTGHLRTRSAAAQHLDAGARKVIISAPAKGEEPVTTVVLGVNFDSAYDPDRDDILSMASCTTGCLAPAAKVLHETVGISRGLMTTIHASPPTRTCSTGRTRICAKPAPPRSTWCPPPREQPKRLVW